MNLEYNFKYIFMCHVSGKGKSPKYFRINIKMGFD